MALEQRRPYVIYDKVFEQFLAEYNKENLLKSGWSCLEENGSLRAAHLFDTRREAERALKKLTAAYADTEGGADFTLLRVKPFVGYDLVEWPEYLQAPYIL